MMFVLIKLLLFESKNSCRWRGNISRNAIRFCFLINITRPLGNATLYLYWCVGNQNLNHKTGKLCNNKLLMGLLLCYYMGIGCRTNLLK